MPFSQKKIQNPPESRLGTSGCGAAVALLDSFCGEGMFQFSDLDFFPLGFSRCLFLIILALGGNNSAESKAL